jgi:hypothetical protein
MKARRVPWAISVLALSSIVVGCAAASDSPRPPTAQTRPSENTVGDIPEFEGPWSDLFANVYSSNTATEVQREILADGVITDAEYTQLRGDFKQCLEDLGLTVEIYPSGGFAVDENGNVNETQISEDAVPRCEQRTVGSVALLYEQIRRNPDQKDEATIVVECLKRNDVVGASYTPAQYKRDLDAYTGLDWNSTAVRTCAQDPLGILEDASAPFGE